MKQSNSYYANLFFNAFIDIGLNDNHFVMNRKSMQEVKLNAWNVS